MPADPPSSGRRLPLSFAIAGSEMASFTVLGLLLDFGLGTMPWFTIVLTLAGLALAFLHLVKMSQALGRKPSGEPGPATPPDGRAP